MKCNQKDCDGTLCMMHRSGTHTNLIGKSLIYLCEKCDQLYVLKPEVIDPIAIEDGRDQVLLFLERCLEAAEHELIEHPPRGIILGLGKRLGKRMTERHLLEYNLQYVKALMRTRKKEK